MRIRTLLVALSFTMLAPPALAAAATERWRHVSAPNFQVYSELGERQTAAWIRDYDQFITATSEALGIPASRLPPLTVVLFARDRTYAAYKLMRPNGRAAKVAGQFSRSATWSVIGLAMDSDDEATRQTIFHEGTHWLMSADPGRQPAWFSEGIAEMLSTFDREGDKVTWGKPVMNHLALLQESRALPMREFLTQAEALSDREEHTDKFYAQSWAFVHFLMMSPEPERRQQFNRFLATFKTSSGEAAVREAFGADLASLESQFASYARQHSFSYVTRPAKSSGEPPTSTPASPAAVEAALALLAFGAERLPLAREHAERAVALAPGAPAGHEVLAYLANKAKDREAVARHAGAAVAAGSKDSEMHVLRAFALPEGSGSTADRVKLLEQAIDLRPHPRTYRLLSEALLNQQQPRAEDRLYLERGLALAPGDDWLKVGHAAVSYRLGERPAALTAVQLALRADSTLDARQRAYAMQLRRAWVLNELGAAMSAAGRSGDFSAARGLVERHRGSIDDAELATTLDRASQEIITRELYVRLQSAQRSGRVEELPALIEQLLARPDLPAELRSMLEQTSPTSPPPTPR